MRKYFLSIGVLLCLADLSAQKVNTSLYLVQKNYKDENCGFINASGEIMVPCIFNVAGEFSEGVGIIMQNKKWGLINTKGVEIVPPQYDYIGSMSNGLAVIKTDGKYGYINSSGKVVIEPIYSNAKNFNEGLGAVKIENNWGYINNTGMVIIPPRYDKAYVFREGMAKVVIESKEGWLDGGFINKLGKLVIPCKFYTGSDNTFELTDGFYNGLSRASLDGRNWGFINKTGNFVIKPIYSGASNFKEGLASVWKDNNSRMGYINIAGKEVINFDFEGGEDFSDGIAKVKIPTKKGWHFINKSGNLIADIHFPIATEFKNGLARVIDDNNEHYYIDKQGKYFHSYYSEDIVENIENMKVDDNGTTYTGKTKNGIPDGYGKYSKPDGSWYEGGIKNWIETGLGTMRATDGKRYYGNWIDGNLDGVVQVKEWTLGGLVSNEWYAKYEMGKFISAEQTKNDFDKFLNSSSTSSSRSNNEQESTEKKPINSSQIKIVEFIINRSGKSCCAYRSQAYCFSVYEDGKKVGGEKTISKTDTGDWETDCGGVVSGWKISGNTNYTEALKNYYKKKYNKTPLEFKITE